MTEEVQPHVLQQYQLIKKIGSGAYGHVWKVVDRQTKAIKALKKNFDAFSNSTDAQRTYRQVMFLRQLHHPNIITLQKTLRAHNNKDIYLVFQHMDIDLHTLIREDGRSTALQERHKQYIIYQIAKALFFLHNSNLIHRDLKPSNVLINQNCEAKLCDFGLVRLLEEPEDQQIVIMTDYIATRWYRAPELLLGSRDYSKQVDIWALGCLVGEMFYGKAIFPGTSTINQIQKVIAWTGSPSQAEMKHISGKLNQTAIQLLTTRKKLNRQQFFGSKVSPLCLDLIGKMLQFDPSKRLSIQQIIRHPYLSQFYEEKQFKQAEKNYVKIELHINDNTKMGVKDYRQLLYNYVLPKKHSSTINNTPIWSRTDNLGPQNANNNSSQGNTVSSSFKSKQSRIQQIKTQKKQIPRQKSRLKTQILEGQTKQCSKVQTTYQSIQDNANFTNGLIYSNSRLVRKQVKSSLQKNCKSKQGKYKKGISLCSKSMSKQSSQSKNKYMEYAAIDSKQLLSKQSKEMIRKIKSYSRSCTQKYDKVKKVTTQIQQKSVKKVQLSQCFINQNIGRKGNQQKKYRAY